MKKILCILTAVLVMLSCCGCSSEKTMSRTLFVFDTVLTLTLYGGDETSLETAADEIEKTVREIHNCASAHDPKNQLYMLNVSAYGNDVKISDTLFEIIEQGLYYCELTDGAFDITLGKIIGEWAIGSPSAKIPDSSFIEKYSGFEGWKHVVLNHENKTVRFEDERIRLDLGGVAKGYAAEKAKEILGKHSITKAMLDFGGNIVAVGRKNAGKTWTVGVKNPSGNDMAAAVGCENTAIVTSGNYERYSEIDGARYHHILDPFTGCPSDSGVASATVIYGNSAAADCLSTAVFVLGAEKGMALIESIDGAEAVFIDANGNITLSSGAEKITEIL